MPYLGGGEGDADLDLALVRLVGEHHVVLGRVEVVRAALRAQADDVRHVDPASSTTENERNHSGQFSCLFDRGCGCSCRSTGPLIRVGRQALTSPRRGSRRWRSGRGP